MRNSLAAEVISQFKAMDRTNLLSVLLLLVLFVFALTARKEKTEEAELSFQTVIADSSGDARELESSLRQVSRGNLLVNARLAEELGFAVALVKPLGDSYSLFEHNVFKQWPLASITKLMTAIVALENINPNQYIAITKNAIAAEGTMGNFSPGEVFILEDLVKAMIVASSNDAAEAIAEFYGRENFVKAMNAKAAQLSMFDSNFVEPAGLALSNQSTVFDIEKLVSYIYNRYPQISLFSRLKEVAITDFNTGIKKHLANINIFAGNPNFIGGKTGYTDEANGNLVSLFSSSRENDSRPILIVVFGADNRFKATEILWQQYR